MRLACLRVLTLALGLSACATRDVKPTEAEMDRAEAALQSDSCVGDLAQWSRHYFYHARYFGEEVEAAAREGRAPRASGHVRTQISFAFQLADMGRNEPGRVSMDAPPPVRNGATSGDGMPRRVFGSYDLRDGRLDIARCDPPLAEKMG